MMVFTFNAGASRPSLKESKVYSRYDKYQIRIHQNEQQNHRSKGLIALFRCTEFAAAGSDATSARRHVVWAVCFQVRIG